MAQRTYYSDITGYKKCYTCIMKQALQIEISSYAILFAIFIKKERGDWVYHNTILISEYVLQYIRFLTTIKGGIGGKIP